MAPSRAIARTGGVAQPAPNPGGPLGRSGLDLLDVVGSTDSLVARRHAAPLAMEIGLEQARGALVRQLPGDALAALDAVWESAQRTEEGWFLRSGSLLVLGLPGECERVAERGLEDRPQSTALRFAQSLARLAVGDPAGARAALQSALQRLPSDPLLLAQQAVVLASQGDAPGAETALRAAGRRVGADDPAVQYGRDGVTAALRAVASERARHGSVSVEQRDEPAADHPAARHAARHVESGVARDVESQAPRTAPHLDVVIPSAADERAHHDPITLALRRLGSRVREVDVPSLTREIRVLLRALSAGGALGTTGRPEQAHAARRLLTIMASVLTGEQTDAPPAKRALVSAVIATLRSGHLDDVARAMRPASGATPVVGESFGQLMQALVDGAQSMVYETAPDIFPDVGPPATTTDASPVQARSVVQDASQGLIVPVRLGLRLIDETPESRALQAPAFARVDERALDSWQRQSFPELSPRAVAPDGAADRAELNGRGWGIATANASTAVIMRQAPAYTAASVNAHGVIVRMAAVSCIMIAAVAAARGYSAVAIACGIGAAWLALRRAAGTRRRSGAPWGDTAEWRVTGEGEPPHVRDLDTAADESSGRR